MISVVRLGELAVPCTAGAGMPSETHCPLFARYIMLKPHTAVGFETECKTSRFCAQHAWCRKVKERVSGNSSEQRHQLVVERDLGGTGHS